MPEWSSNTDDTSLSLGMSALDLDGLSISSPVGSETGLQEGGISNDTYNAQLEGLDNASKEAVLVETFPGLKPFDIKWTLNKCKGNAGLAIDELLHQVFLEENGERQKGIEAFSESDLPERPRKGKGKGKKKRSRLISESSSDLGSETTSTAPSESKWDRGRRDIEFITSKTGIPSTQISSIYHTHGASVPATINAIIDGHLALSMDATDPMAKVNAHDLGVEFPMIPPTRILALVELTHPSSAAAHELAKALLARPARNHLPIQIEVRLPPPILDDATVEPKPKTYNAAFTHAPVTADGDADYLALRHTAFTQARAAHRAAKSNPLMGGAASYYSQLGRDYHARAAAQTSADADALVAAQSSSNQLDLHGVNVKDGVRIARERVTNWWASKRRMEPGMGYTGYKIVTGRGVHSEGGRSKLGPAVGGMLIREGWKVQVGSGALLVTGVVLKR